jgi:hypothetical protein
MGRTCVPLRAAELPPLQGRFEWLALASSWRPGPGTTGCPDTVSRDLTLLLCVDPSSAGRWARRQLAAGCLAGEVEVRGQPAGADLRDTLAPGRAPGGVDGLQLVLVLPAWEPVLADTLHTLLHGPGGVLDPGCAVPALVAVVAEDCGPWQSLGEGVGFVQAAAGEREHAGLLCWQLLAALSAPEAAAGVDLEDLRPCLGTAAAPARMGQLMVEAASGALLFESPSLRERLARAGAVSLLLSGRQRRLSAHQACMGLLRDHLRDDAHAAWLLPSGQWAEPALPLGWVAVTVLMGS